MQYVRVLCIFGIMHIFHKKLPNEMSARLLILRLDSNAYLIYQVATATATRTTATIKNNHILMFKRNSCEAFRNSGPSLILASERLTSIKWRK